MNTLNTTNPQEKTNRVEVVDAIRGIAVAMILMLHSIEHFNFYDMPVPDAPWLRFIDQMIWDGLWYVIGGKAYAIFALLFGFSFYIMYSNAEKRGIDFRGRFCWRLVLLFLFGNLNAAFFCGEVLVLYSIVGFVLPLVCRLKTKTVLIIAAICMLQPIEWIKMIYAIFNNDSTILQFNYREDYQFAMQMLAEGNFIETLKANLWEGQIFSLAWAWGNARFFQTASLFMIGMVAGRIKAFADTPDNRALWAKIFTIAFLIYLPTFGLCNLIPAFTKTLSPEDIEASSLGILTVRSFSTPLLLILSSIHKACFMFMIVTGLLFAFYCTKLCKPMKLIMPYGRMSLTNYITQSIIGSFLFYHWGLNLKLCDTWSELLGLSVLIVQICFCTWWMKNHKRGPLEEVWRKLTWIGSDK